MEPPGRLAVGHPDLAHGAGAPMDSPFMERIAELLAAQARRRALRVSYRLQRRGGTAAKRPPNPQAQLLDCWRRVHAQVRRPWTGPLAPGGKSMAGAWPACWPTSWARMPWSASATCSRRRQAGEAAGRAPAGWCTPTLIVQGERDAPGNREAVAGHALAPTIRLHWLAAADHDSSR
ncbi:alpha/beta family hydrolase [Pseudomonas aeruginosa]